MKKLLVVLFLVFGLSCYSQNVFLPGYIINLNGDTIHGFIYDNEPSKNHIVCVFKKALDDEAQTYEINDLLAYRYLDGKFYIAKELNLDHTPEKVFLQWIIKGKMNIYSYLTTTKEIRYFLENDTNLFVELKNSEIITNDAGRSHLIRKKEYIGTLNYLMKDANINPLINRSKLEENSLINLVKVYTDKVCDNETCVVFEKPKHKTSFVLYIGAGQNFVKLNFDNVSLLRNNEYEEKIPFHYGLSFEMKNLNFLSRNISFMMSLYYHEYSLQLLRRTSPEFKIGFFQIPLTVDYSFPIGNFEPFLSLGLNVYYKVNIEYNNTFFSHGYMSLAYGGSFGAGVKYKFYRNFVAHLGGYYSLNIPDYIFNSDNIQNNNSSVKFKIGYMF